MNEQKAYISLPVLHAQSNRYMLLMLLFEDEKMMPTYPAKQPRSPWCLGV